MKKRTSKDVFAEALIALAKEQPVARITVKEIVKLSGLSLQTFYNHFRDKNELVLWLFRQMGDRALVPIEKGRVSFHDLLMNIIRFYDENAGYLFSSFGTGLESPYIELSADVIYKIITAFIRKRRGSEELSEELSFCIRMYSGAGLYILSDWVRKNRYISPENLAFFLEQSMPEQLKPYLMTN